MQIRKRYREVDPKLLYDELKDFILKQGVVIEDEELGTYSLPNDSSSFISRGTLIFKTPGKAGKECLRVHIVGSARDETKLMLDINEAIFAGDKVTALQADLDFVFSTYEVREKPK
jgi:hypothetical protein